MTKIKVLLDFYAYITINLKVLIKENIIILQFHTQSNFLFNFSFIYFHPNEKKKAQVINQSKSMKTIFLRIETSKEEKE